MVCSFGLFGVLIWLWWCLLCWFVLVVVWLFVLSFLLFIVCFDWFVWFAFDCCLLFWCLRWLFVSLRGVFYCGIVDCGLLFGFWGDVVVMFLVWSVGYYVSILCLFMLVVYCVCSNLVSLVWLLWLFVCLMMFPVVALVFGLDGVWLLDARSLLVYYLLVVRNSVVLLFCFYLWFTVRGFCWF